MILSCQKLIRSSIIYTYCYKSKSKVDEMSGCPNLTHYFFPLRFKLHTHCLYDSSNYVHYLYVLGDNAHCLYASKSLYLLPLCFRSWTKLDIKYLLIFYYDNMKIFHFSYYLVMMDVNKHNDCENKGRFNEKCWWLKDVDSTIGMKGLLMAQWE